MMKIKLPTLSIFAVGISSIMFQIVFLREVMNAFSGNELMVGATISIWLFLTGIGSYLGRRYGKSRKSDEILIILQTLLAFLPLATILLLRYSRANFFIFGQLIDPITSLLLISLVLSSFCLILGFTFPFFCSLLEKRKAVEKVYIIDSLGDFFGGLIFSFCFVYVFNSIQSTYFLLFLNLFISILLALSFDKKRITILLLALLLATIPLLYLDLNLISLREFYKGQEIIFQKESVYGNLVVTKTRNQLNFFENNIPLFSTSNQIENEETIHYAMSQSSNPTKVLLLSGGISGTLNELLKYEVKEIDYVELDPVIIELGRKFTSTLNDSRIRVISSDARLWVRSTKEKYDVVIIDLPDPSSAQLNRFYTLEFFKELKNILKKDGVISLSLISSENYLSKLERMINAAVYNSLKSVFSQVMVIPGEKNFFIASDRPLTYNISARIKEKNISTSYVNEYYLKAKLTEERINYVNECLRMEEIENRDFVPIGYYHYLLYWLSQFNLSIDFSLILVGAIFLISSFLIFRFGKITLTIFTTGFSSNALEIVLLIGFQIIYGYVYTSVSIMVTLFILGIFIGSLFSSKKIGKKSLKKLIFFEFLILCFSSILAPLLKLLNSFKGDYLLFLSSNLIFPSFAFLLGFFVGGEFPLATNLWVKRREEGGILYASDLLGGSLGGILASLFLIPLLGIEKVCMLIALIKLANLIILKFK